MAKVVSIKGGPVEPETPEPCLPLIEMLENALAMAKAGTLQSFIGLGFQDDGDMYYTFCDFHERKMEMYGALQWMVQHYHSMHLSEDSDVE